LPFLAAVKPARSLAEREQKSGFCCVASLRCAPAGGSEEEKNKPSGSARLREGSCRTSASTTHSSRAPSLPLHGVFRNDFRPRLQRSAKENIDGIKGRQASLFGQSCNFPSNFNLWITEIREALRYTSFVHHEHALIAAFVKRSKRDRYREILSNPHLRHESPTSSRTSLTSIPSIACPFRSFRAAAVVPDAHHWREQAITRMSGPGVNWRFSPNDPNGALLLHISAV
jgi:hypothetical protein